MDRQQVQRRVRRVVIKALGLQVVGEQLADDEILFGEGLGAPSVAALQLVCALEEEFGFEVDDDELRLERFESVQAIAGYIEGRLLLGERKIGQ